MPNVLLCLEKSSDLLEAYSFLIENPTESLDVIYIQNERNDRDTVQSFLLGAGLHIENLSLYPQTSHSEFFAEIQSRSITLQDGDALVAPFIRYRPIWGLATLSSRGIKTVHLSESIPDSFGHIGYRIGYRGRSRKTWLTLPQAKLYALTHRLDVCYFPLMPEMVNPFVRKTLPVRIPPLVEAKRVFLEQLLGSSSRPQLIGGFGYDPFQMASYLGMQQYVATTKSKEIIVDGELVQTPFHIAAEEVMLANKPSRIISYPSTALVWAKRIDHNIPIDCYRATVLEKQYGALYTVFAQRALKHLRVVVKPEQKDMLEKQ